MSGTLSTYLDGDFFLPFRGYECQSCLSPRVPRVIETKSSLYNGLHAQSMCLEPSLKKSIKTLCQNICNKAYLIPNPPTLGAYLT